METKFKAGDVVKHKCGREDSLVILFPLKIKWRGYQRYKVIWYDGRTNIHSTSTVYEQEVIKD